MSKAKKEHLRQYRYARYKYLYRGGKYKINRATLPRDLYIWIKPYLQYAYWDEPDMSIRDSDDYKWRVDGF